MGLRSTSHEPSQYHGTQHGSSGDDLQRSQTECSNWPYITELTRERDELRAEVEKWKDLVKTFSAGNVALEAENERLQRENGALARMYALAEEKLRERTGRMNDAESQVTTLEWELSEANKEIERLRAENAELKLRPCVERCDERCVAADGAQWADLQSDTESIDGDQVL